MGKVILHQNADPEAIERRRAGEWMALSPEERWARFFRLHRLAVKLNGGNPLKRPQGKGLLIKKVQL